LGFVTEIFNARFPAPRPSPSPAMIPSLPTAVAGPSCSAAEGFQQRRQEQQQLVAAWQAGQPAVEPQLPAPLGLPRGHSADAGCHRSGRLWHPKSSSAEDFARSSAFRFKRLQKAIRRFCF